MPLNVSLIDNVLTNSETNDNDNDTFDLVKIGIASPQRILGWSYGEVTKPETINYRTLKPEREGLFCEKIFGPAKDWECHCGKYKRVRHRGIVCERCGVEVTESKVRRHRMGHIKLAAPVCHIWYLKGIPSHISLLLDMPLRQLEDVTYYNSYVVIEPGNVPELSKKQLLSEEQYENLLSNEDYKFDADIGAPAVKKLLANLNLKEIADELRKDILDASSQKRAKLVKRLRVVEYFINTTANPSWMVLDVIPVIPPDLRPMVQLDGGRFATSDLNDLYRRVINRNNRLSRLLDMEAPDIIIRNEKRMLQEAVDALVDNGRRGRAVVGPNNRSLKSLSDIIEGKQGRFRQNLLGKRVDYSGRSVIVVGPTLRLNQCGLPKEMALELFKPFVMNKLVERGIVQNIKSAKKKIESQASEVWDVLEEVIKGHPVLLNRAPTLHRLGIQAFEPILVEGRAIQLHPLVCTAFNADFDGDQMAVHVPLSIESQTEAKLLMLATNNILLPATGKPVITPSKDMVLGCYYITVDNPNAVDLSNRYFANAEEVISEHQLGYMSVHSKIKVRMNINTLEATEKVYVPTKKSTEGEIEFNEPKAVKDLLASGYEKQFVFVKTTVGRVLFNKILPKSFKYINRIADKKELEKLVAECFLKHGNIVTSDFCDSLKDLGYHFATFAGISFVVSDLQVPEEKKEILRKAEKDIERSEKLYQKGEISAVERYNKVIDTWAEATELVTNCITDNYDKLNSIYMMAFSGARGNLSQVRQLVGMRGLMSDPSGKTIDLPIKSNFREGLSVTEYIISSYGARKGIVDTALRTADSGYLTRRLADVAQDVIITDEDCGTQKYIHLKNVQDGDNVIVHLRDRLPGRIVAEDLVHPKTGEIIVARNEMIFPSQAKVITDEAGYTDIKIRSPLVCQNKHGVCRHCYGWSLTNKRLVDIGEAVGTIAAQSIGEPGTQLTMRTFHTGGVYEAANKVRIKAQHAGVVKFDKTEFERCASDYRTRHGEITKVTDMELSLSIVSKSGKANKTIIPSGFEIKVKDGDILKVNSIIAEIVFEKSMASQKSVEKAYRDINANISGTIKFVDFSTESKKDRQGLITRTANSKGVIWVLGGNVYSLPSDCELLIENNKLADKNQSLARISAHTEYGGIVQIADHKSDGSWKSLSILTAQLKLLDAELLLNRKESKDVHLRFTKDVPINTFQMTMQDGSKLESGSIVAEAFVDKYVTPTSGEIRFINIQSVEKNTIVGKSQVLFLPEETYQLSSVINPLIEDSCMVEAGAEIIPNISVKESGFVSLENFELSQTVIFYPGAQGVYFPIESSSISVIEGQEIKVGDLIGQLIDPETNESQPIYSTQKGMIQFIHAEEGMFVVVRNTFIYEIEPIDKFYDLETTHESIDLVPVTKLMVRNGDKLKEGTSFIKVNLVLKLNNPLIPLGGKVEFIPEEDEEGNVETGVLSISVIETLTSHHDPSIYERRLEQDLKIHSTLKVKEGDVIKAGSVVSSTDFITLRKGRVEVFEDSETKIKKLLIVTDNNLNKIKLLPNELDSYQVSQFVYEGDKIGGKTLSESGLIEAMENGEVAIRKGRPYLISAGSQLLVEDYEMVQQGETLATLVYEQLKTGDIIQGLPRVEELLEARKPKESTILSEYSGKIKFVTVDNEVVSIEVEQEDGSVNAYKVPLNSRPVVFDGQIIKRGDRLIPGPINPHDMLQLTGIENVQQFLVDEVQGVYRSQGVEINDKHLEIIVRQMTRKLRITSPGESTLLPGEIVTIYNYDQIIDGIKKKAEEEGRENPEYPQAENVLLGITKASLNTESFISAASFQETTRVLTEAAIEGKKDYLRGLKENVIIGRLIPAGTGMKEVQRCSALREEASMEITIG